MLIAIASHVKGASDCQVLLCLLDACPPPPRPCAPEHYETWKYYQSTSKAHANVPQNLVVQGAAAGTHKSCQISCQGCRVCKTGQKRATPGLSLHEITRSHGEAVPWKYRWGWRMPRLFCNTLQAAERCCGATALCPIDPSRCWM